MGRNKLNDLSTSDVLTPNMINEIYFALEKDFVGRNAKAAVKADQALGTELLQWLNTRGKVIKLDGETYNPNVSSGIPNSILSGKVRTTSNQPAFLTPAGSGNGLTVDIKGATTNMIFDVNGNQFTMSSDLSKTSLQAAPSTNNTALVDDAGATDNDLSRTYGEFGYSKPIIVVDNMGQELIDRVGTFQAFTISNGTATEYFVGRILSITEINKCFRGFFYDSALAPVPRVVFSDNDTITLLQLGWVFLESNAVTIDVSYNTPVWSFDQPLAPVSGDYWNDLANETWKRYSGTEFITVNRTLIGLIANDDTDCLGARCIDFSKTENRESNFVVEKESSTVVKGKYPKNKTFVRGVAHLNIENTLTTWDITSDLAGSTDLYDATEQADRNYFLYFTDTGDSVISDFEPYHRYDLLGWYHPNNPWRCLGMARNDNSSNFDYVFNMPGNYQDESVNYARYILETGSSTTYPATPAVIRNFSEEINIGDFITNPLSVLWDFSFRKLGNYRWNVHLQGVNGDIVNNKTFKVEFRKNGSNLYTWEFDIRANVSSLQWGEQNLVFDMKVDDLDDSYTLFGSGVGVVPQQISLYNIYIEIESIDPKHLYGTFN